MVALADLRLLAVLHLVVLADLRLLPLLDSASRLLLGFLALLLLVSGLWLNKHYVLLRSREYLISSAQRKRVVMI